MRHLVDLRTIKKKAKNGFTSYLLHANHTSI
jgi:hypothetical protein